MWLPLVSMLVIRSIDTNDPFNQQMILYIFVATHLALAAVALKIRLAIASKGDKTPLTVTLPKAPFGEDPNKPAEVQHTYVEAYDLAQLNELMVKKIGIACAILGFIYWKWQAIIPFAFQSLMNPYQMYQHPLFQIFIMGKEAKGDLQRPFPVPDPLPSWMKGLTGGDAAADNKSKDKKNK